MSRRTLPIGIQTFSKIREDDCYYVDKTDFALRLIESGAHYVLSRPRRFGKSLFLDTLAELFGGNEALFRGLYVHGRWDWERRYPVVRISFAEGVLHSRADLDEKIRELHRGYADKYRADGCPIYLIGVEFSREQRGVVGFEVEAL